MQPDNPVDPYVYPDSNTLINRYDIRDSNALQTLEGIIFAVKSLEPLPEGNFDTKSFSFSLRK